MKYYINTLREGMRISEIYLCKSKQISLTKNGKEYGSLVLQDKTGTVDAKIWDLNNPGIGNFEALDYIRIDADVTLFMNANQLNIKRVRRVKESEYDPADYLPVSSKDIGQMYNEVLSLIATIRNPYLHSLAKSFFVDDEEFAKAFRFHSAAKSVHHAFVGGLLEHTLGVMKLCDYFASGHQLIHRDLLLTAALFHDVGKIVELSDFPANDYTDDGQLLGHIIIGAQMVSERIKAIPGFPDRLASELRHCILAHHGELEYGSPKKPALLEALALNLADNADAKLETMSEILYDAGENQGWLGFNRFLDSNVRKTTQE